MNVGSVAFACQLRHSLSNYSGTMLQRISLSTVGLRDKAYLK